MIYNKKTHLILLVFVVLFFSSGLYSQNYDTIYGKITTRPCPPESIPTLHNLVYAVRYNNINYITTINGEHAGLEYFGTTYEMNDSVKAIGTISVKQDCQPEDYYEIELTSIEKLAPPPENVTIEGVIVPSGNPGTTYPVLPGMVWQLLADETYYVLTINDYWFGFIGEGYDSIPVDGKFYHLFDSVVTTGYIRVHYDIFNEPYYTFEPISMDYMGLSEQIVTKIDISPNPSTGHIRINTSADIKRVDVYDMNGKQICSKTDINGDFATIDNIKAKGVLFVRVTLKNNQFIVKKIVVI